MNMNMKKMSFASLCILALLAGCKFEGETRISPDGSGQLRTEVGFSAEERQNLEQQNPTDDFCNVSGAPAGVSVNEEQRGAETWCVTAVSFDDLDELAAYYEQRQGLRVNRLEISAGRLHYDLDMDTTSESSGFSAFETITWTLILPAAPAAHNADRVNGNTLTWYPAPDAGLVNLRAESEAGAAFSAAILLIVVLALVLAALAGFVIWRSAAAGRKKEG
jgi:hypothetical protein